MKPAISTPILIQYKALDYKGFVVWGIKQASKQVQILKMYIQFPEE